MKSWTSQIYLKEHKIYRGAFNYIKGETNYAEETFDVYRTNDQNFAYVSECLIKLSTGEFLNINVEYIVSKEFLPLFVMIEHSIGKKRACETYSFNNKDNSLNYTFLNSNDEVKSETISIPPRFHIATPTAATAFLFIRTKRFDSNSKNYYSILQSTNYWTYNESPSFKIVTLERENISLEKIKINGQELLANAYKVFEQHDHHKTAKNMPFLSCFLSQHGSIPYLLFAEDGTRIEIKYLNDLNAP